MGRCKSLGSLKSFLSNVVHLSGASILCFSHPELPWGSSYGVAAVWWVVDHKYFSSSWVPLGFTSWHWRAVTTADCDIFVYWYGEKYFISQKIDLALGGKRARERPEQRWQHFILGTWSWLIMDPTFLSSSWLLPTSWLLSACLHPRPDPAFLEFKSAALLALGAPYCLILGFAYLHTFNKCCIWTAFLPCLIRQ